MVYKGRGVRDSNTIRNGHIPLWLAVHETGHVIACHSSYGGVEPERARQSGLP